MLAHRTYALLAAAAVAGSASGGVAGATIDRPVRECRPAAAVAVTDGTHVAPAGRLRPPCRR